MLEVAGPLGRVVRELLGALTRHPGTKLASVALAVAAWWWVQGQEVHSARVRVDLEARMPEGLLPAKPLPAGVLATLEGPRAALRRVQGAEVRVLLDLSALGQGSHEVPLDGAAVTGLLPSVRVVGWSPGVIGIDLDTREERSLRVVAASVGEPAAGYDVVELTVSPDVARVVGPATLVQALDQVNTEAVDLTGLERDTVFPVSLDLPRGVAPAEAWSGSLTAVVASRLSTLTLTEVPVVVWRAPDWRPAPESEVVTVKLEGPTKVLRALRTDRVVAMVELPPEPEGTAYTARFQAADAPRVDVLVPRADVVRVLEGPPPVKVERR